MAAWKKGERARTPSWAAKRRGLFLSMLGSPTATVIVGVFSALLSIRDLVGIDAKRMTHAEGGLVYGPSWTFEEARSSFAGLRAKEGSLNDLLVLLLDVALPARFFPKLSLVTCLVAREPNMLAPVSYRRSRIYSY